MSYNIQDAITEYVDERVVESIKEEVESSKATLSKTSELMLKLFKEDLMRR